MKQLKIKQKNKRFLGLLLGSLAVSLSGSALAGKRAVRGGEGTIRAGQDF